MQQVMIIWENQAGTVIEQVLVPIIGTDNTGWQIRQVLGKEDWQLQVGDTIKIREWK